MAARFIDILWSSLVLLRVECVRIVEGFTVSSPLDLYDMPHSHGLIPTLASAVLAGGLGAVRWGRRGGVAIGLCVAAHWFLDLPVHVPDLPLWDDSYKVGFGLWDRPGGSPSEFAVMALTSYFALAGAAWFIGVRWGPRRAS